MKMNIKMKELFIKKFFDGHISGSYDFGSDARVFPNGDDASPVIVDKIRKLIEEGIELGIVCTLTKRNVNRIDELFSFFKGLGCNFRVNRATKFSGVNYDDFLTNEEYVKAMKHLFDLYLADSNPTIVLSNFCMMVKRVLRGDNIFCVGTSYPEYHLAFESHGRVFSRCRITGQFGNIYQDSPQVIQKRLSDMASCGNKVEKCLKCKFYSSVCEGPCFGESNLDCDSSNCGYRGEISLELWEYVESVLSNNGIAPESIKE